MGIEGRSLNAVVLKFRNHLNGLLAKTVTRKPLILVRVPASAQKPAQIYLSFRDHGRSTSARLKTEFGDAWLSIHQRCESSVDKSSGKHRLNTSGYQYTIGFTQQSEPLLRWEYVKNWPNSDSMWCRHHLQGSSALKMGRKLVRLDDLHLPTGYVTIEEVLRFCIVDLGVKPLSKKHWHDELERSYQRFKAEFTS